MKGKVWVISLGGSRIIPNNVDEEFLKKFKKLILSHKNHKFVIVTGGGTTARKYINAFQDLKVNAKKQSKTGVAITRFHANFLMSYFGKSANHELPFSIKRVKNLLLKNKVVFCGALREQKKQTTDGTAAKIAVNLRAELINITNVAGLYTSDPKKNKSAKLIRNITWKEFNEVAKKIKFKAGQHFILDQKASKIILKRKVPTYIVNSIQNLNKILNEKEFKGTLIKN